MAITCPSLNGESVLHVHVLNGAMERGAGESQ